MLSRNQGNLGEEQNNEGRVDLRMCPRGLTPSLPEKQKQGWDPAHWKSLCMHPAPASLPLTPQSQKPLSMFPVKDGCDAHTNKMLQTIPCNGSGGEPGKY